MSLSAEIAMGITGGLETTLNTALHLDPEAINKLERFSGKIIAIELQGLELTLFLLPGPDGISLMSQYDAEPDTILSGTPLAMAKMALGPDASKVLFAGEVTIRGDVETGQGFKRLLDELDIDWEEQLARYTGDIAAHKLGELFRATLAWGQQALDILGQDATEYFQQEGQDLPVAASVRQFMHDVDTLRDDAARLESRLARLQQHVNPDTAPK
jgi:ubiquinone biosynthesis protein UbiJ